MNRNLFIVIFSILGFSIARFSRISSVPAVTPGISSPVEKMAVIPSETALRDQPDPQSSIRITVEIPRPPAAMPLYKLKATGAPVDFLNEKLERVKLPALKLDKQRYALLSGSDKDKGVHAFIDMRSGDAEFVPNLADVVRTVGNAKPIDSARALTVARAALKDERFIPKDATELRLADPVKILGGANTRPGSKSNSGWTKKEPALMMSIVPALRYAGGFRVYGLGSHAVVTLK